MKLTTLNTMSYHKGQQTFSLECVTKYYFSYFSTKTYVVGSQKNRLNETFEHPKHMLKLMGKKYLQVYAKIFCLSKDMARYNNDIILFYHVLNVRYHITNVRYHITVPSYHNCQ